MQRGLGNIPSGGSSLFLGDFTSPLNAVSQRIINDKLERQKQSKEKMDKSEEFLLNTLDFKTIEGLSDKVTERLLEKQNEIEEKWAGVMMDNDMVLSDKQRLEMRRDMREYERTAASRKFDVAKVGKAAMELSKPNSVYKYDVRSWKALDEAEKAIENGEPVAGEILYDIPDVSELINNFEKTISGISASVVGEWVDDNGEKKYTRRSNVDKIQEVTNSFMENDLVKRYLEHPQVGKILKSGIRIALNANTIDQTSPAVINKRETAADRREQEIASLPEEKQQIVSKYSQLKNVPAKDLDNAIYYNDFTKRFLNWDEQTLDEIENSNIAGFGKPTGRYIAPNGDITFHSPKGPEYDITIEQPDWSDPGSVKRAMTTAAAFAPNSMGGKQVPSSMQSWLVPEFEVDVKDKPPVTALERVRDYIDISDENIDDPWTYIDDDGNEQEGRVMRQEYRQAIVEELKELFPDDNITEENTTGPERRLNWGGKPFNLRKEEGRKKLSDKIDERLKEEGRDLKGYKTTGGAEALTPEQEAAIDKLMELNPDLTREEIIKSVRD